MEQLIKGFVGEFAVKSIEPEAESYQKSGGAGIGYAHKMILIDSDKNEYRCQICDETENFTEFPVGAHIKIEVKTFGRGVYTIRLLEVIASGSIKVPAFTKPPLQFNKEPSEIPDQHKVIALQCASKIAIMLIPEAGVNIEDKVIQVATAFEAYLRK